MNRIFIKGLQLPGSVRGCTVLAPDDDFVVFINTNLCEETQHRTIKHELNHIRMEHLYNDDPVVINEMEAG